MSTSEAVLAAREHFSGQTYQDIARADGDVLPPALRERVNPPQPTTDIPFRRYTDKAFFDLEMRKMWRQVWQYACRDEHVPEVGDYYVYDIGRYSLIIVRTNAGLRAYHNSCLHRGTKLKASGSSGWMASLQCPFHGWHWTLDGSLKNIPCDWEFPHLQKEKQGLPQVRVESWNGFIFVNFSPKGPSLIDYLEVMPQHFRNWDLTGWYVHTHVQKRLPGNWKLAQESFMEAYHTPIVHPEMTHVVSDHNMQHDIFSDHISRDLCAMASPSPTSKLRQTQQDLLNKMLMGDASMIGEKPLVPDGKTARWVMAQQVRAQMQKNFGLDYSKHSVPELIDSLKYNVFPNLFIYPAVGFPLIQQFRPDGNDQDRCLFDQMVLRPKPTDGSSFQVAEVVQIGEDESYATAKGLDPFLAHVLDQDTNIMRWQREGMYASEKGAQSLSIYQESRIRHMHQTLDKYLKA
jgi:phenylpropionate dioxygenase-like ring-hydroxylating dioxygenase large terminal subunit